MTQKQSRKKIESLKEEIRNTLQNDALKYKRAVIREIDYLWANFKNKNQFGDIEKFADFAMDFLKVPKANRFEILSDLKETQLKIGEVWKEFYSDKRITTYKPVDYEKLIAAYSVDFPQVEKETRDFVVKTFNESIHKDYSFEIIRTNLLKTSLGSQKVYTIANTAVAQFDNASMFEFAQQAGVEKYLYDGILNPDSRLFCVKHFKKVYTLEQIKNMDNGQGLDVWTSCGGWNCSHFWTAQIKL